MLINMCLFDHESNTCSVTSQLTTTHPFSYLWERKLWPICTSGFCSPFNDERRTVAINLFIQHIAKLNKKLNLKMINLRDQTSHDSISLVMFPSSKLKFCWSCKLVVLLLWEVQKLCYSFQIMPKITLAQSIGAFLCVRGTNIFLARGSQSLMLTHVSGRA